MGALRLLAESYSPTWLNEHGFSLYKDFRPEAERWGERAEMKCARVLALRKEPDDGIANKAELEVTTTGTLGDVEDEDEANKGANGHSKNSEDHEPFAKRVKSMSVEEYEAALDDSDMYGAFWDEGL